MSGTVLAVTGLRREARALASTHVQVVVGGGDVAALQERLSRTLQSSPAGVISIGLGGALATDLRVGDWVVADSVVGPNHCWDTDTGWTQRLRTALETAARPLTLPSYGRAAPSPARGEGSGAALPLPLREREGARDAQRRGKGEGSNAGRVFTGSIVGGDAMVVRAVDKAALYTATGALAVDMESHVAAQFAADHGLPFAALRVISDTDERDLPRAVLAGMTPDGGMNLKGVLASLARDPRQLPSLIWTGREAGVAFRRLALLGGDHLLCGAGIGCPYLGELLLDVP